MARSFLPLIGSSLRVFEALLRCNSVGDRYVRTNLTTPRHWPKHLHGRDRREAAAQLARGPHPPKVPFSFETGRSPIYSSLFVLQSISFLISRSPAPTPPSAPLLAPSSASSHHCDKDKLIDCGQSEVQSLLRVCFEVYSCGEWRSCPVHFLRSEFQLSFWINVLFIG